MNGAAFGVGAKKMAIINYYESLLNKMDAYVEKSIEKISPNDQINRQTSITTSRRSSSSSSSSDLSNNNNHNTNNNHHHHHHHPNQPCNFKEIVYNRKLFSDYVSQYNMDFKHSEEDETTGIQSPKFKIMKKVAYFNWVRERATNELKRVQKSSLEALRLQQQQQQVTTSSKTPLSLSDAIETTTNYCAVVVKLKSAFSLIFEMLTLVLDFKLDLNLADVEVLEYYLNLFYKIISKFSIL